MKSVKNDLRMKFEAMQMLNWMENPPELLEELKRELQIVEMEIYEDDYSTWYMPISTVKAMLIHPQEMVNAEEFNYTEVIRRENYIEGFNVESILDEDATYYLDIKTYDDFGRHFASDVRQTDGTRKEVIHFPGLFQPDQSGNLIVSIEHAITEDEMEMAMQEDFGWMKYAEASETSDVPFGG